MGVNPHLACLSDNIYLAISIASFLESCGCGVIGISPHTPAPPLIILPASRFIAAAWFLYFPAICRYDPSLFDAPATGRLAASSLPPSNNTHSTAPRFFADAARLSNTKYKSVLPTGFLTAALASENFPPPAESADMLHTILPSRES